MKTTPTSGKCCAPWAGIVLAGMLLCVSSASAMGIPAASPLEQLAWKNVQQAWAGNFDNPNAVQVQFSGLFTASGAFSVTLNGETVQENNENPLNCAAPAANSKLPTPTGSTRLRLNKVYPITATGESVYGFFLYLAAPPPRTEIVTSTAQAPEQAQAQTDIRRYEVLVYNEQQAAWQRIDDENRPQFAVEACSECSCSSVTKTFYVQVRLGSSPPPRFTPGLVGEDAWISEADQKTAGSALGDGEELTMSSLPSGDRNAIGYTWSISLGRLLNGLPAGSIRFNEEQIDATVFSPAALTYVPTTSDGTEVEVIRNPDALESLAQIKTAQTLVSLVLLSQGVGYEIRFYPLSALGQRGENGQYTIVSGATPLVRWIVDSTTGGNSDFRLREVRPGTTYTSVLQRATGSSSTTWTLTRGSGAEARIETREVSIVTTSGQPTRRVELHEIKNGAGTVAIRDQQTFEEFSWGYSLTKSESDPGGASLVTTFGYGTAGPEKGQLVLTEHPDGFWEKRFYVSAESQEGELLPPGALYKMVQPWKDSPQSEAENNCFVTQYDQLDTAEEWGEDQLRTEKWHDAARFHEERTSVLGDEISTVYAEASITTQGVWSQRQDVTETRISGGVSDDGEHIQTTYFHPADPDWGGKIKQRVRSDKVDVFSYTRGNWNASQGLFAEGGSPANAVLREVYHGSELGNGAALPSGGALEPNRSTIERSCYYQGNLVRHWTWLYTGSAETPEVLLKELRFAHDALGHLTSIVKVDPVTQSSRTLFEADYAGSNSGPGGLLLSQVDEEGARTTFQYDSLKRLLSSTREGANSSGYPAQSAVVTAHTYDANDKMLTETVSSGGLAQTTTTTYDLAGRVTFILPPTQLGTTITYPENGHKQITSNSAGETKEETFYLDRRLKSIKGTAVTNVFLDYDITDLRSGALYPKNITTNRYGSETNLRWTTTTTDLRYEALRESKPAFRATNEVMVETLRTEAGETGKWETSMDGGTWVTDYELGFFGSRQGEKRWLKPLASDGSAYNESTVRRFSYEWGYRSAPGGRIVKFQEKWSYPSDAPGELENKVRVEAQEEFVNGFAANEISETLEYDAGGNGTRTKVTVDRGQKKVTTTTTSPASTLSAVQVAVNGLLQTESTTTVATPTQHFYDALGRETSTIDPLGNPSSTAYDPVTGQVISRTGPNRQATLYHYYPASGRNAGLLWWQEEPGTKRTYYDYNSRGQLTCTWGDVPYPEKRTYNEFGDLVTLTTYRSGGPWNSSTTWPNPTGGDVTQWVYDEPTGLLTNKIDAAGAITKYDYDLNHYPRSTVWARGASLTRSYTDGGDLAQIEVTRDVGAATTIVYGNYNRLGLPRSISDESGVHTLTYSSIGQLTKDECTSGLLAGVVINQRYDSLLRKDRSQVQSGTRDASADYIFSTLGRLGTVSNGVHSATYAYLANSDLIQATTHSGSGISLMAQRTWRLGYRLESIQNRVNGDLATAMEYTYDQRDRRTTARDGSRWLWTYSYNDRSELRGAYRTWPDGSPVSGQTYEYDFDDIGNRTATRAGGDADGANLTSAAYTANNLNQYSARQVPGFLEVIGLTYPSATVTINDTLSPYRKSVYFHGHVSVANSDAPVAQQVSVRAVNGGETKTETGTVLFPKTPQAFTYDADGNLKADGLWEYQWDGQNQLIQMTSSANVSSSARKQLDFTYDHQGRRIQKVVKTWAGSAYGNPQTTRFVYDDWRLIAELDVDNHITRSYTWGIDLSGSLDGAAGIGGLVVIRDFTSGQVCFPTFDGNGNVTALINAANGTAEAIYEYGPFGEMIRASGPQAKGNPFSRDCKFTDLETDLTYYGLRYYSASLGRWLSKDPIDEEGGLDLYALVGNNPLNVFDPFGLIGNLIDTEGAMGAGEGMEGGGASQAISFMQKVKSAFDEFNDLQQTASDLMDASSAEDPAMAITFMAAQLLSTKLGAGGKGHHIHAKKAFEGNGKYDPSEAFTMSLDVLEGLGVRHESITGAQKSLFTDLAKDVAAGRKVNSMREHTRIAVAAMVKAGVPLETARKWAAMSLLSLRRMGVTQPSKLPWKP